MKYLSINREERKICIKTVIFWEPRLLKLVENSTSFGFDSSKSVTDYLTEPACTNLQPQTDFPSDISSPQFLQQSPISSPCLWSPRLACCDFLPPHPCQRDTPALFSHSWCPIWFEARLGTVLMLQWKDLVADKTIFPLFPRGAGTDPPHQGDQHIWGSLQLRAVPKPSPLLELKHFCKSCTSESKHIFNGMSLNWDSLIRNTTNIQPFILVLKWHH